MATDKTLLVTGSSGLIGSEVVDYFCLLGWTVHGVDNNMRADFFRPQGDTRWHQHRLGKWWPHGETNVVIEKQVPCHTCLLDECPIGNACIKAIEVEKVVRHAAAMLGPGGERASSTGLRGSQARRPWSPRRGNPRETRHRARRRGVPSVLTFGRIVHTLRTYVARCT